jgi:hypothetical protein
MHSISSTQTRREADRVLTLAPGITEVSEVLDRQGGVEPDLLVEYFLFEIRRPYLATALDGEKGLVEEVFQHGVYSTKDGALGQAFREKARTETSNKFVIVRARSIDDARLLLNRNRGLAY